MEDLLKLSAEKIYNKEFSIEFKGYSPKEIDSFLDVVIKDYQIMDKISEELFDENRRLKYEIATLEAEIIELKASLKVSDETKGVSNIDLLRRLSRLEEIILNREWHSDNRWETRGKSMLAHSEMSVVFM